MNEPDEQLVHAELVKFATAMPTILFVSVVDRTVNGWTIAFYSKDNFFGEGNIASMINDYFSMAIKVVGDLSLGEFKYFISIGAEALEVLLPLTETYGMVLIVQSGTRIDKLMSTIKPYCESLLKYLPD